MAKNDIVINNWADGIAPSLHAGRGLGDIQCCDIRSIPGILRTHYALKKDNEAYFKTQVYQIINNNGTYYFLVDPAVANDVGLVIKKVSSTYSVLVDTTIPVYYTAGAVYKGYLILRRATINDAVRLSDSSLISGAFGSAAFTVNGSYSSIVSDGKILYMASGYQVKTVYEKAGQTFNPSDSNTYTFDDYSLTLEPNFEIFDLQLVGSYLAVIAYDKSTNKATVFYWDRVSDFYTTKCDLPVRPKACIVDGEWIYYIGGRLGEIHRTAGTVNQFIKALPENIVNLAYSNTSGPTIYKDAIAKDNGKVYFATSGSLTTPLASLWELDLNTMALSRPHILSTGNTSGATETIDITALYAGGGELLVAYQDNNKITTSIHAVDVKDTANFTGSYGAYVDTQMFFNTDDAYDNAAFKGISVFLSKPLASGDKIKIAYRTAENHKATSTTTTAVAFTDLAEFTTAGQQYMKVPFAHNLKSVQLRIYLEAQTYLKSLTLHR